MNFKIFHRLFFGSLFLLTSLNAFNEIVLVPDPVWKEKEAVLYRTPQDSTKAIQGEEIPYVLWIDGHTWEEIAPLNTFAEKSFKNHNENAYAMIVSTKDRYSLEALEKVTVANGKLNGFENASVVSTEKRILNDKNILFIHWKADMNKTPVDFYSYIYTGPEGTVFVHAFTRSVTFAENKKGMEHFLNGLALQS